MKIRTPSLDVSRIRAALDKSEQAQFDDYLIGALSVMTPEDKWKVAVATAERLVAAKKG